MRHTCFSRALLATRLGTGGGERTKHALLLLLLAVLLVLVLVLELVLVLVLMHLEALMLLLLPAFETFIKLPKQWNFEFQFKNKRLSKSFQKHPLVVASTPCAQQASM
jgi:hypothetical protein